VKKFAELDPQKKVINVIVARDDFEKPGFVEYTDSNPAFIGGDYFEGMFYEPQPFESWTRSNGRWIPPVPMPEMVMTDKPPKLCQWNESTQSWEMLSMESLKLSLASQNTEGA
jgi:hypothetical protein